MTTIDLSKEGRPPTSIAMGNPRYIIWEELLASPQHEVDEKVVIFNSENDAPKTECVIRMRQLDPLFGVMRYFAEPIEKKKKRTGRPPIGKRARERRLYTMDTELLSRLAVAEKKAGLSQSEIINRALAMWLDEQGTMRGQDVG